MSPLWQYKYSIFKKKFHNKVFYGAKIQCIEEKKTLGSSGSLYNARKKLKQNFLFCNGDTFFDINLSDLINEFFRGRKIAQLALKKKDYTKKYDTFGLGKKHLLIDDLKNKKKINQLRYMYFFKKDNTIFNKKWFSRKKRLSKLIRSRNIYGKEYKNDFRYGRILNLKNYLNF